MHYVKAKGILSAKNGMNLYRGCTHGCIYCDSRSSCYQINHDFEDIEVKENALELLEDSLRRKRTRCMISTGSMSDPYMPIEKELQYTRRALELAEKYGFGFTLITKSSLVLRDLDLLERINRKAKCVIQMTLTTYDEDLCRILEPNVSATKERFETLKELNRAGIPTVIWLTPILPFINDTKENLLGILDYAHLAGVRGIICFGMGLTLRDGNREYFYRMLDKYFPNLKDEYIKRYGSKYEILSPNNNYLMSLFHQFCQKNNILDNNNLIFSYLNEFKDREKGVQLTLF